MICGTWSVFAFCPEDSVCSLCRSSIKERVCVDSDVSLASVAMVGGEGVLSAMQVAAAVLCHAMMLTRAEFVTYAES